MKTSRTKKGFLGLALFLIASALGCDGCDEDLVEVQSRMTLDPLEVRTINGGAVVVQNQLLRIAVFNHTSETCIPARREIEDETEAIFFREVSPQRTSLRAQAVAQLVT